MTTLSARGFSAWISINGEPLPVYKEETSGETCSAWIPSRAGQAFSVSWKNDSSTRIATAGHVFIDGREVASGIMRPGRTKPVERSGAKTDVRGLRPFCFSVLNLTDDETVASEDDPTVKEIGTIKIEVTRVKLGGNVPFQGYNAEGAGFVHERAKKLGVHCTSYGPKKRTRGSRTVMVSTAPYDPDDPGPYVTFVFRYRAEDLLRANGIIASEKQRQTPQGEDDEILEISEDTYIASSKKRAEGTDDIGSVELDVVKPSLLQPENKATSPSPAKDQSQTQADDYTQVGFGIPSGLLQEHGHEKEAGD